MVVVVDAGTVVVVGAIVVLDVVATGAMVVVVAAAIVVLDVVATGAMVVADCSGSEGCVSASEPLPPHAATTSRQAIHSASSRSSGMPGTLPAAIESDPADDRSTESSRARAPQPARKRHP